MIRFTEEHLDIRDMVASFSDNELRPMAARVDHGPEFPREGLNKLAELGILGLVAPEEHGGINGDLRMVSLVLEELARGCASTAMVLGTHLAEVTLALRELGSEAQQSSLLPRLASGELLGSFCIAEVDAECDAGAIACVATRDGDDWVLDGVKKYVVAGSAAGLYLVVARAADVPGTEGLRLFLVDGGAQAAGVRIVGEEDMLGMRGCGIAEVAFEECRVPASALLGEREQDFDAIRGILAAGRIGAAAIAAGVARSSIDYALIYAGERRAFGRSIDQFEAIRNMIADGRIAAEAGRLLTYNAAALRDAGSSYHMEASMAKLQSCEGAYKATKSAVQVLGGNGYSREYPVERMYRDAKTLEVLEAPAELHRRLVARALIGDKS
ncbi:MAG: acyl-CoA dehydrogenase family protein [Planctomycetota bacterium]